MNTVAVFHYALPRMTHECTAGHQAECQSADTMQKGNMADSR